MKLYWLFVEFYWLSNIFVIDYYYFERGAVFISNVLVIQIIAKTGKEKLPKLRNYYLSIS